MTTEMEATNHQSWQETPPLSPPLRHWSGGAVESQHWLDTLADPLQSWARGVLTSPALKKFKNILHGTWLGHPVHPMITDIPLGSWTASMLFDLLWLASEREDMASAADVTMALGLLGAGAAAVTGLTDWSETDATDRRVGLAHGLLNAGALTTNLASYGLRRAGKRRSAIALASLGYAVSMFAAYLGGELSFAKGIGVNHVAWEGGADGFVGVLNVAELPEKKLTRVDVEGIPAVLWKENQAIYAIAATCSHLGGPLDEGTFQNGMITCPWHASTFKLSDGSVVEGPAVYAQPTFAVRVRAGQIELRRMEHA